MDENLNNTSRNCFISCHFSYISAVLKNSIYSPSLIHWKLSQERQEVRIFPQHVKFKNF